MFRQVACLTLILTWVVAGTMPAAWAQSSDGRSPSLSDRLEQFRDDLLGTPSKPVNNSNQKNRRNTGGVNNPNANPGPPQQKQQQQGQTQQQGPPPQGPIASGAINNNPNAQSQLPEGPIAAAVNGDAGPANQPPAGGASRPMPTGKPSSRRTAQPTYKTFRAPPQTDTPTEPESRFPAAEVASRPETADVIDAEVVEDSGVPTTAQALPLPNIARSGSRGSSAAADKAEPEEMDEPEADERSQPLERREVVDRREPAVRPEAHARAEKSKAHHKPPHAVPHTLNPSAKEMLLSGRTPALAVEVHGPRKVMISREATFKVMLKNSGDVPAEAVTVTLDIPSGAEVVDVQTTTGTYQPIAAGEGTKPLAWEISRLPGHSDETMTLKLIPRQNTPIDLAVHWACTPENAMASLEVQEPKLAMSLSGPTEVMYGQSRSYKLIISNPGNGDAENVVVSLMPIGRAAEAAASHRLGVLAAGASKSIEVELTARQAGELAIRAQASADGGLAAEVAEAVLVRRANLQLDVEGPKMKYAGTKGIYRIRLANTGNAVAEGVQVSAMLPPQATYQSSSTGSRVDAEKRKVVWNAGHVPPGEERLLEVQCVLQAPGENRLQVASTASQELSVSGGAVTLVESLADLKLEVHDPPGPIATGEDAVYEIVVKNRGSKAAENVDLVIFFSSGLEATSVQGGPHEIGAGQVVLKPIASLPPGAEKTFKIHVRADRAGNHVFRAEVVCAPLDIKLTSEQATRFYGDDANDASPPMVSRRPERLEPVPQ